MEVEKLKGLDWIDVCMQSVNFLIGSLEDHTAYLLKLFIPMKLHWSISKRMTMETDQRMLLKFRMNS